MVKSGLDFFFEIQRALSEIPANLPGQFLCTNYLKKPKACTVMVLIKILSCKHK